MPRRAAHPNGTLLFVCLPCLAVLLAFNAYAQPKPAPAAGSAVSRPSTTPKPGAGPTWSELEPSEQIALRPLQNDWASIDELGKRKWRRIAERYPEMSATDQERLQNRMTEWAKLTPQERGKVMAAYSGAFNFGLAAAGLILGHLVLAMGYRSVFAFASVISLVAFALLAVTPQRHFRPAPMTPE